MHRQETDQRQGGVSGERDPGPQKVRLRSGTVSLYRDGYTNKRRGGSGVDPGSGVGGGGLTEKLEQKRSKMHMMGSVGRGSPHGSAPVCKTYTCET